MCFMTRMTQTSLSGPVHVRFWPKTKKRGGVAGGGGCVCLMWRGMGVAVEEGGGVLPVSQ